MKRILLVALVVASAFAATARAQGVDLPRPSVSEQEVRKAIRRGVEYLYDRQTDRGDWEPVDGRDAYSGRKNESHLKHAYGGRTALACLALLYAGESPEDPRLKKALNWLSKVELTGTYAVGLRTGVWSKIYTRRLRPMLQADADWLMSAMITRDGQLHGNFYYSTPHPSSQADHSNTQYGMLGLRDAAIRGIEIPDKFWLAAQKHMVASQAPIGGWSYYPTRPTPDGKCYGNMTVGGLANLYIIFDMLTAKSYGTKSARCCGRRTEPQAIDKSLAWLDRNLPVDFGLKPKSAGDKQTWRPHGMSLYYLYGLERCGHASGRKTFGGLNWFEQGARWIISRLDSDDKKTGTLINSIHASWTVLFLSKGSGPVYYNKLDTGGDWNNNARDIANLSKFIGQELEQRINWQVVDINDPVETWLDAPCLFFNGQKFPQFTDQQKRKLRLYTDSGGLLVAEAGCSKPAFIKGFMKLAKEVWPEWELQRLGPKHPVRRFHHKIRGRLPKMMHIHDGCRSRVVLILEDMACAWNRNARTKYLPFFKFGMNLARYAGDARMTRSRLYYRPWVLEELQGWGQSAPARPEKEARVVIADWPTGGKRSTDIRAMRHLAETLSQSANVKLEVVTLEDNLLDRLDQVSIVHMSGHYSFAVGDKNLARLQAFVKRGGLIWADAQCGREAFKESFQTFLKKLLPEGQLTDLPADDQLVTGRGLPREGFNCRKIRYKRTLRLKEFQPSLQEVKVNGRRAVLYSPRDLTCGMDGHDCANCLGPQRNDALKIGANIVLSALPPDMGREGP